MSLAEANRKYFDLISESYDSKPWFAKVDQQVTDDLRSRLDWIGIPLANNGSNADVKDIRLLDYACGTGAMSRLYAPYVTVTRGIDISPNMVANYNAHARSASLRPTSTIGIVGDLFGASPSLELSGPEYHDFDLATVGFGFHHFGDVVHAAKCLKERLRPGGVLIISEFLEGGDFKADEEGGLVEGSGVDLTGSIHGHDEGHSHGHHSHGRHHGHGHGHGNELPEGPHTPTIRMNGDAHFTMEGVRSFFTDAGFQDVDVRVMDSKVYIEFAGHKMWRTVLFAKGRRPIEDVEDKSEL